MKNKFNPIAFMNPTALSFAEARDRTRDGTLRPARLVRAFLRGAAAAGAYVPERTAPHRLEKFTQTLKDSGVNPVDIPPAVRDVMAYAAAPHYDGAANPMARYAAYDSSIFSANPVKVVGGSDAAVAARILNGSAINSTQELSTMCYRGTVKKTDAPVVLCVFISNAYRVDFDEIEKRTGIHIERDENGNPAPAAREGAASVLNAAHGFFNPAVVGRYCTRAQADASLPPLRVVMHDMLLKTRTHTGTVVTNAGHNQFNWEIDPRELRGVFEFQLRSPAFKLLDNIGIKRNDCWQVDASPIYLFGGNPPRVLQELKNEIERRQTALIREHTGNRYQGDHWKSNISDTSSNQAVLSMDLAHRANALWENEIRPHIAHQLLQGVTTIAFADGASNFFVPFVRELIEDMNLHHDVTVVSYPQELQKHIESQNLKEVYLLATGDGLEMGAHSIFAPLAARTQVHTPADGMKTIPALIDDPKKPGRKIPDPSGTTQQVPDKNDTRAKKIAKIEALLRAVKDSDGLPLLEHKPLLEAALAWIPNGASVVLGATELELLHRDPQLQTVFAARQLDVISPLMDLVAPAIASRATAITQPPVGRGRDATIPDALQTGAPDHEALAHLRSGLAARVEKTGMRFTPVL
ncbi:MAG: hypothetical protein KDJ49_01560 [Alphaproteobacteria bacterium]|nr:hypothetical protein [Alphaproteobacteria bacterium]USO07997.1 MAG: hypothetical protein H6866_01900 [Rhodospirillales bacterium]